MFLHHQLRSFSLLHLFYILRRGFGKVLIIILAPSGFYIEWALRSGIKFPYIPITQTTIIVFMSILLTLALLCGAVQAYHNYRIKNDFVYRVKREIAEQKRVMDEQFFQAIRSGSPETVVCDQAQVASSLDPVHAPPPKAKVNPTKQEADHDHKWELTIIHDFYKQYVLPYEINLKKTSLYEPIVKVLDILERFGQCSSMANSKVDDECVWYEKQGKKGVTTRLVLEKVTLIEHSIAVAVELFGIRKKESPDYQITIGKYLLAGLGHDLGKIQELREKGTYRKENHSMDSYFILNNIIPEEVVSKKEILEAVKSHHGMSRVIMHQNLKTADQTVRGHELHAKIDLYNELFDVGQGSGKNWLKENNLFEEKKCKNKSKTSSQYQSNDAAGINNPNDMEWFDTSVFLEKISEKVNIITSSDFDAIEHGGTVYVKPNLISKIVAIMADENDKPEIALCARNRESRRDIETWVRTALKEHIPDYIGKTFWGAKFDIDTDGNESEIIFGMPIHITAFTPEQAKLFEMRRFKSGYLSRINKIVWSASN